jgi:glutamyl/glutaminyl-tRNA synthetase
MSDAKSQGDVRTRFAPSPSGHLHVGGARTALFNWAFARHHGGTFILRIEDTDQKRSSGAASVGFLKDLKWLGIEWDEGPTLGDVGGGSFGPYFQSERLAIYTEHAERLIREGKAYRAFETPVELDAARDAARTAGKSYRYERPTLDLATIEKYVSEGRPHVVRFRLPDSVASGLRFHDEVLGEITIESELLDDFVIIKADGYPTYHFAVVVDDALMQVSHVIRAQEHLNNTFKHVLLQEALGFDRPKYAHVSIIFNPDGSKMSKRDKDKALRAAVKQRSLAAPPTALGATTAAIDDERWAWWLANKDRQLELEEAESLAVALEMQLPEINVDDFRKAGYLPEVLVNYLALLGWNPGGDQEKFDRDFLIEHFSLDRIIKSPAKFDRAKLLAFNLDALQAMPPEAFAERLREHGAEFHPEFLGRFPAAGERFALFARCNQSRSKTLEDPFRSCRFMIVPDEQIVYEDSKATRKALDGGEPSGLALLEQVLPVLEAQRDWSLAELEATVKQFADAHAGGNLGKIAQPLRVAVSGGTVSPGIVETLLLLGREHVLNRIRRCVAWRREKEPTV